MLQGAAVLAVIGAANVGAAVGTIATGGITGWWVVFAVGAMISLWQAIIRLKYANEVSVGEHVRLRSIISTFWTGPTESVLVHNDAEGPVARAVVQEIIASAIKAGLAEENVSGTGVPTIITYVDVEITNDVRLSS